jgi:hypothetical protein
MSKNARPTTEELRFVFDLILKGYDDADILAEYARLYDAGQLMFPYRTDKRFVRECRKELEVALEVAQEHLKKKVDPILVKRREEHFDHLADILKSIIPEKNTTIEAVGSGYIITEVNGKQSKLTKEQLAYSVKVFLQDATKQYGHADVYEYLLPHLEAEVVEGKELNAFMIENPLKFYKTLRFLADKRIFKGKCPMCGDW